MEKDKKLQAIRDQRRRSIEAGLRALLALFATTLGFGLKQIVTDTENSLSPYQWPAFIVIASTFARFLAGSAIHMTYEYARDDEISKRTFIFDIGVVSIFGVIGMWMCYSKSLADILMRLSYLNIIALLWAIIRMTTAPKDSPVKHWSFFLTFNVLSGATFLVLWCIQDTYKGISTATFQNAWLAEHLSGWNAYWLLVTCVAIGLFVIDLFKQLEALEIDEARTQAGN